MILNTRIFLLGLLLCPLIGLSQTKIIAHKSHSGTIESIIYSDEDNYGMAPQRSVETAQLDTVIFINDSMAIMITSAVCTMKPAFTEEDKKKTLWKQGKDTVFNHPLFSLQHDLDSIKRGLQSYYFKNSIDEIVFIGYDNDGRYKRKIRRKRKKDKSTLPVSFSFPMAGMLLFLILCFGLVFRISLKENNL